MTTGTQGHNYNGDAGGTGGIYKWRPGHRDCSNRNYRPGHRDTNDDRDTGTQGI